MNIDEIIIKNKLLEEELNQTRDELNQTKERLKKYTAPPSSKVYYEKHKEKILEKMKTNPPPPDKRKEYNKQAYLRKKEKLIEKNQNVNI
jgi:hypothetical protein